MCCSVLQCVAVSCKVLQCVAVNKTHVLAVREKSLGVLEMLPDRALPPTAPPGAALASPQFVPMRFGAVPYV